MSKPGFIPWDKDKYKPTTDLGKSLMEVVRYNSREGPRVLAVIKEWESDSLLILNQFSHHDGKYWWNGVDLEASRKLFDLVLLSCIRLKENPSTVATLTLTDEDVEHKFALLNPDTLNEVVEKAKKLEAIQTWRSTWKDHLNRIPSMGTELEEILGNASE
jgi:hypothetical protein